MKYLKLFGTHSAYNTYITGQDKVLPNVSYCEDNNDVHYNPWVGVIAKFNVTSTSEPTTICHTNATSNFTEIEIDGVAQPGVVSSYTFDTTGEHTVKYTLSDPTSIGNNAFAGCSSLINITIPNSVTSIGNTALQNTSITNITIPDSVTSLGIATFGGCTSLINIILPNSITTINKSLFGGCTSLINITIPNSVTSIGDTAFASCISLTSITIPNSVTTIGSSSFAGCTSLTSVTIGNSVTSMIGNTTFGGCTSLTSITSLATTAPTIQKNTFQNVNAGGTLYVPSGSTGYGTWMGTADYYLGKYNWTKVEQ